MMLQIRWRYFIVDATKIAHLVATGTATDPIRLARQFIDEFLTDPDGVQYLVRIPTHKKWLGFHVKNIIVNGRRTSTFFTNEGIRCEVENSLVRDLSFIEEMKKRSGLPAKRILRRDVKPFVGPAVRALRSILEAEQGGEQQ